LKTGEIGSGQLSKLALAGFQKQPIGAKDLNSPVLKSFLLIQKLFALNG
jgi:hypothetical protein